MNIERMNKKAKFIYIAYNKYTDQYLSEESLNTIAKHCNTSKQSISERFINNNNIIYNGFIRFERFIPRKYKKKKEGLYNMLYNMKVEKEYIETIKAFIRLEKVYNTSEDINQIMDLLIECKNINENVRTGFNELHQPTNTTELLFNFFKEAELEDMHKIEGLTIYQEGFYQYDDLNEIFTNITISDIDTYMVELKELISDYLIDYIDYQGLPFRVNNNYIVRYINNQYILETTNEGGKTSKEHLFQLMDQILDIIIKDIERGLL